MRSYLYLEQILRIKRKTDQVLSLLPCRYVDVCLKHSIVSVEVVNKIDVSVCIKGAFTCKRGENQFWCHPRVIIFD